MKDAARDRDKGNNFHVTRNATQKAQEPFSIRVELVCVRERHWKGIEPSTSHTTQMLSLGYIPSLFKINCFKRILFTHTQARTLAHGACMHACMHAHTTEGASKSSEEGTGSPAGEDAQCACWECSLQDMCLYVLLSTGPSSAPTPTPPSRFLLRQALHQVSKLALKF